MVTYNSQNIKINKLNIKNKYSLCTVSLTVYYTFNFFSLQKTVHFHCHIHIKVESHHIKVRIDSSSLSLSLWVCEC